MFECIISGDAAMCIHYQHITQQILGRVRHGIPYFTPRLRSTNTHSTSRVAHGWPSVTVSGWWCSREEMCFITNIRQPYSS